MSGLWLGSACGRFGRKNWLLGYCAGLLLIAVLVAARFDGVLDLFPGLARLSIGRAKFVVLSFGVTLGFTSCLRRLEKNFEKVFVCAAMAIVVFWFSIMPFLSPALLRADLSGLDTQLGPGGVCLQSTDFTCGPAAAVTALKLLGFEASEGRIAVMARSNPLTGTLPGSLCSALDRHYRSGGLECRYVRFDSVGELYQSQVTLVVVKDSFLRDHYVVVTDVSDTAVTVADPAVGRKVLSRSDFEKIWRFCGIVLNRAAS
jgi:hypothetical protein